MSVRYGNDLYLSTFVTQIEDQWRSAVRAIRDGQLDYAFRRAHDMQSKLESLKERLNDLEYKRDEPR